MRMLATGAVRELVERRIRAAQERGEFDNLAGAGKPQRLDDDRHVPPELRMGYRILRNADCVPPEVEARRELVGLQRLLADATGPEQASRATRRLSLLAAAIGLRPDSVVCGRER